MFKESMTTIFWALIVAIIILYPILISIHVYFPLFIGLAGYLIIWGFEGHGVRFVWLPLAYLINLEVNLSLPLFLTLLAVLTFYLTLYEKIRYFKRCTVCVGLFSVIFIDLYYFIFVVGYDFMFDTSSIIIDSLLLYSLVFDLIFVVLV